MGYTLNELAADIHRELSRDRSAAAMEAVCRLVSRALTDREFVADHLKDRAAGSNPREILYEDPQLGFCICGHVYDSGASGSPHDHGSSWAIYGQAAGVTEMTDWKIVAKGEGGEPSLVEPVRTYQMHPGDARFYDVGAVHSPKRKAPVKLIRIEGENLDRVRRANIKAR
jgi:predicted metal-dependent enzyme (double-stranded beta helix superfamily)